jgi:hypothetical protein
MGTLTITDAGVSFEEKYKNGKPKHPHAWRWDYQDIQQLKIARRGLLVGFDRGLCSRSTVGRCSAGAGYPKRASSGYCNRPRCGCGQSQVTRFAATCPSRHRNDHNSKRAQELISSGVVEALHSKAKVTIRKP